MRSHLLVRGVMVMSLDHDLMSLDRLLVALSLILPNQNTLRGFETRTARMSFGEWHPDIRLVWCTPLNLVFSLLYQICPNIIFRRPPSTARVQAREERRGQGERGQAQGNHIPRRPAGRALRQRQGRQRGGPTGVDPTLRVEHLAAKDLVGRPRCASQWWW